MLCMPMAAMSAVMEEMHEGAGSQQQIGKKGHQGDEVGAMLGDEEIRRDEGETNEPPSRPGTWRVFFRRLVSLRMPLPGWCIHGIHFSGQSEYFAQRYLG